MHGFVTTLVSKVHGKVDEGLVEQGALVGQVVAAATWETAEDVKAGSSMLSNLLQSTEVLRTTQQLHSANQLKP